MAATSPEDVGRRVAELYQELSFPSAAKLQSALLKEGILINLDGFKALTSESGARQVHTTVGPLTSCRLRAD